jgi:hypothetical protein
MTGPQRVRGVVTPPGAVCGQLFPDPNHYLSFAVRPWRAAGGGEIFDRELRVRKAVAQADAAALMAKIWPGSVVAFDIDGPAPADGTPASMTGFWGRCEDAELCRLARLEVRPATHHDPEFGELVRIGMDDGYSGTALWNGAAIALYVGEIGDGGLAASLAAARQILRDQGEWQAALERRAVADLLELKNEVWLEEKEQPVTAGQFVARMTPESLGVYPDGAFEFMFGDGDLFWGHAIIVAGSLAEGATDADICG